MHQLALIAEEPPPETPVDEPRPRQPRVTKPVTAPRQARSYIEFTRMMIAWRRKLGLSLLDLDHRAGFADGHTSKLEAPDRTYGRMPAGNSLEYWLGALGLAITLKPIDTRKHRPTLANPHQLDLFTGQHHDARHPPPLMSENPNTTYKSAHDPRLHTANQSPLRETQSRHAPAIQQYQTLTAVRCAQNPPHATLARGPSTRSPERDQ